MITINLLPEQLRPVKRTPLPYILGVLFLAAALVGMAFVYLQNQHSISVAMRELEQNQQELEELKPIVEESNKLVEEKKQLAVKLETIQEIVRDRVTWSEQLHNLNRLAPQNLWFEGISVENKPFKERVPYIDPRTGQTKEKVVRVDRPVLKLEGYVISIDGETPTISPLTLATEQDKAFSDRFQLLTTAFADTTFENFPVRSFTLEYSIEVPESTTPGMEDAGIVVEEGAEEAAPSEGDTGAPTAPETETTGEPAPGIDEPTQEPTTPAADTPGPEERAPKTEETAP